MRTLLLVSVLTFMVTTRAYDYCSETLCKEDRQPHVACGRNTECPKDAAIVDLSPDINTILELHNEKRNQVAGGGLSGYQPAAHMATMQWDYELASLAVFNVGQCRLNHDKCHNTKTFPSSGQNLGEYSYNGASYPVKHLIQDMIEVWYGEHINGSMGIIREYRSSYGPIYGHFTLMVNDGNTHVGCAASRYSDGMRQHFLLACNYAANNLLGVPVYESSAVPASGCRTGTNQIYKNLCSTAELFPTPIVW